MTSSLDTAPVFDLLRIYVDAMLQALGDDLVGVYVYGSMVYGAYDPGRSDVDVAVLHRVELADEQIERLGSLHEGMVARHLLARTLDATFVPLRCAGGFSDEPLSYFRDGRFVARGGGDVNPVMWHTLRTRGIALCGPPPAEVVPAVSAANLAENMRYNLRFLSRRMPVYVLSGAENQVFGVLSLCRVLYTLRTGEIESKAGAARWALERVEPRWRPVVERALDRYERKDLSGSDSLLARRAVGFARYISRIGS